MVIIPLTNILTLCVKVLHKIADECGGKEETSKSEKHKTLRDASRVTPFFEGRGD